MVRNPLKMDLTKSIFIGLVLLLFFLFVNNPFAEVQAMANANLLLIGSLGILIFGIGTDTFFPIKGVRDLTSDAAVGLILGVIGVFAVNIILKGAQGIYNLTGTIQPTTLAAITTGEELFFISIIYPLTETLILVGGGLWLYNVLKGIKGIPYPKVIAALVIVFLFAGFHFQAVAVEKAIRLTGGPAFEYSLSGFVNFIGNIVPTTVTLSNGAQVPVLFSAFPQLLLGLYWIAIGYAFRSWIVPAFAHIVNNTVALVLLVGMSPFLFMLFVLYAGIIFVVWQKNGLKELNTFSLKDVFV